MLFFSVSVWASASLCLLGSGERDPATWTIALLIGLIFFVLLMQRWVREWRALRTSQRDPRIW